MSRAGAVLCKTTSSACPSGVAITPRARSEQHDLGIRMVTQRLQLAGHAVINLGGTSPRATCSSPSRTGRSTSSRCR
jgi:methanogenic corrinoid protein MtbC1